MVISQKHLWDDVNLLNGNTHSDKVTICNTRFLQRSHICAVSKEASLLLWYLNQVTLLQLKQDVALFPLPNTWAPHRFLFSSCCWTPVGSCPNSTVLKHAQRKGDIRLQDAIFTKISLHQQFYFLLWYQLSHSLLPDPTSLFLFCSAFHLCIPISLIGSPCFGDVYLLMQSHPLSSNDFCLLSYPQCSLLTAFFSRHELLTAISRSLMRCVCVCVC